VLSKFGFAVPMKNKTSASVIEAFTSILRSANCRPVTLECDQGTEFWSKEFN